MAKCLVVQLDNLRARYNGKWNKILNLNLKEGHVTIEGNINIMLDDRRLVICEFKEEEEIVND